MTESLKCTTKVLDLNGVIQLLKQQPPNMWSIGKQI